jgi:hypothetical protein
MKTTKYILYTKNKKVFTDTCGYPLNSDAICNGKCSCGGKYRQMVYLNDIITVCNRCPFFNNKTKTVYDINH